MAVKTVAVCWGWGFRSAITFSGGLFISLEQKLTKEQGAYRTLKVVFHEFPGPFYVRLPGLSRTIYVHFPRFSMTV